MTAARAAATGTVPTVSVLIVNHHSHALTRRAVLSVLDTAPQAEVLVVDNSQDGHEAQALAAALPPAVRLQVPAENLGFGRGCNLAYEQARGEHILLLNPDAYVLPGCIAALSAALQGRPRAAAVAPTTLWDGASGYTLPVGEMQTARGECLQALGLRWPALGRWLSQRFRAANLQARHALQPIAQTMLSGGCMMIRRSAIEAVGGLFDPGYFLYYEDTDLCRRLRRAGWQLLLEPRARAVHEWRNDPAKGRHVAASRSRYMQRHEPAFAAWDAARRWIERRWPVRPAFAGIEHLGPRSRQHDLLLPETAGPWVLEVSAHPLLVPAVLQTGSDRPRMPAQAMDRAHAGRCYARLTDVRGHSRHFSWDVMD